MTGKKKDKKGRVLRQGEYQRKDGTYQYRWADEYGKRHYIYNKSLNKLREEENRIQVATIKGISTAHRTVKFVDFCRKWFEIKDGIKTPTMGQYLKAYKNHIMPYFERKKLTDIKHSDLRRFYRYLRDEKQLGEDSIHQIHTVIHQVFDLAAKDDIIASNPADKAYAEIQKQAARKNKHRSALTVAEQSEFFRYISNHPKFYRWEPLCTFLVATGLRAGEATGLQWSDIDFENGIIHIDHIITRCTLPSLDDDTTINYNIIQSPKSRKSARSIPLMPQAKAALERERLYQQESGQTCKANIDGYDDFIFLNSRQGALQVASVDYRIKCVVEAHNKDSEANELLLPSMSSHIFRHTFSTRMTENGMHPKALQTIMGHENVDLTMNVYTDASMEYLRRELEQANTTPSFTPFRQQSA